MKSEAVAAEALFETGDFDIETMRNRKEMEQQIRLMSDESECFENQVFEIGCKVLAKECRKLAKKCTEVK